MTTKTGIYPYSKSFIEIKHKRQSIPVEPHPVATHIMSWTARSSEMQAGLIVELNSTRSSNSTNATSFNSGFEYGMIRFTPTDCSVPVSSSKLCSPSTTVSWSGLKHKHQHDSGLVWFVLFIRNYCDVKRGAHTHTDTSTVSS